VKSNEKGGNYAAFFVFGCHIAACRNAFPILVANGD